MQRLTIVMYHYVRDLANSRYPAIKGLNADQFVGQLDYLARHYRFVTMEQTLEAIAGGPALPANGVLLTFDDGYLDHFATVFPILANRGIQGSFFPPAQAILEHRVLDVNKIHFVLAMMPDPAALLRDVYAELDRHRAEFALPPNADLFAKLAVASRYDSAEVIFVKRLLQRELPYEARQRIADALFQRYVGVKEDVFARELYVNVAQLRCMRRQRMFIGSHGFGHFWLNTLTRTLLDRDLDLSLEFLEQLGIARQNWVMCYPYGGHNAEVHDALRVRGCAAGLTTEIKLAELTPANALTLGRLDTNDLPKQAAAPANDWTKSVLESLESL